MSKKVILALAAISIISFLFTVVDFRIPSPPCFNSDEAAFSYNAYSILKTGRDEYGTLLPLRLKSFGDYKMPLFSYFSIPFIASFGLNELGARAPNAFLSLLFPLAVFFLTKELFKKNNVALIAAFLSGTSLGLHILARHAHEAYLAALLTTTTFYFLIRFIKKRTKLQGILMSTSLLLMLFSYHPGRLFAGLFFVAAGIYFVQTKQLKKNIGVLILIVAIVSLFEITDIIYKPARLTSLLFFSNAGTQLKVQELKTEGGIKYLYNPLLVGLRDISFEHLNYFSPQFLLQNGDSNDRFGYKGMGLITPVEYLLFFVGMYYVLRKKEEWRFVLLFILFFSPLSASLSWSTQSLTRSLFLLIPISILAGYGTVALVNECKKQKFFMLICIICVSIFGYYLVSQWDFYLFHYPKRLTTIHAWQCGYKEVGDFVNENYNKYDKFYITRDIGMPYIFTLFYSKYPPEKYQKQAHLSAPDEYGFGQVEGFDKFVFTFKNPEKLEKGAVTIGSRNDFTGLGKNYSPTIIAPQNEPMFEIYASSK